MSFAAHNTGTLKERRGASFPADCFFGVLLAFAAGAVLLPTAALLLMRSEDPARLSGAISYLIALLLPLIGGYLGARKRGHGGALLGLSIATVTVFLFLAVALTLSGGVLTAAALPLYGGMLLTGTVGGRLAMHRKKKHRRHRYQS